MIGGGVTAAYLDDDCWPDLVFTGGDVSGMRFYHNNAGRGFTRAESARRHAGARVQWCGGCRPERRLPARAGAGQHQARFGPRLRRRRHGHVPEGRRSADGPADLRHFVRAAGRQRQPVHVPVPLVGRHRHQLAPRRRCGVSDGASAVSVGPQRPRPHRHSWTSTSTSRRSSPTSPATGASIWSSRPISPPAPRCATSPCTAGGWYFENETDAPSSPMKTAWAARCWTSTTTAAWSGS